MTSPAPSSTDRDVIIDHIHEIFRAYLDKDRDTIRRTHTADWCGFQVKSREMVRGIDAYMENADGTLANTTPLDYELIDTDVTVYSDVAVVHYLASYTYRDNQSGEQHTVGLRAADIYRREMGGWNQCGSNICIVPPAPTTTSKTQSA